MKSAVAPFSLKDAPALIERLLPVQKLSAEAYKEQMAVHGKTLTALGSYWKGRKPLILNKACILGCLLPATEHPTRDLEIFEKLMAMDESSFAVRAKRRPKPMDIAAKLSRDELVKVFDVTPSDALSTLADADLGSLASKAVQVVWRQGVPEVERRRIEARLLPSAAYRERVNASYRPEEVLDEVHLHIWDDVNAHLGTDAKSIPELVEQLGLMRFGRRPRVADTFCGSGQIPFEAARLGCDVQASDLNPVACMLTWGALNVVGADADHREAYSRQQESAAQDLTNEVDKLGVETDGNGWRAKVFLYCVEARCPQTGWMVPLLPSLVVGQRHRAVLELVPDLTAKRYDIKVHMGVGDAALEAAKSGTIGRDGKYGESFVVHTVKGVQYKTKLATLRGDYTDADGVIKNRLRPWGKLDFMPQASDLLQERLYCIQWVRPQSGGKASEYEFRAITLEDQERERVVQDYVAKHLPEWQSKGWLPSMRIEVGGPPRYQGLDLVRARGWTHWHHLFNPRQLLVAVLANRSREAVMKFGLTQLLNNNSRLSRWLSDSVGQVKGTFDNQALNTIFNYGCRSAHFASDLLRMHYKHFDCSATSSSIKGVPADKFASHADIFVTDPPYGDAVKYEEILDFFIAWLRGNPPVEFADWVWDSRRALAIKGEDEAFRRNMVAAYRRMTDRMPDNGLQVIMFTHQSGAIWADMANIVWASGLQVTAAWYVVTETDSALRDGSHVKGTVLLVLRKRRGSEKTTRDDLAWEIQEEVEVQVGALTGLNQEARTIYRDENVFEDADIQMAGYAASLRVLTRYAVIDGRDMTAEAIRPRVKGETTFVDGLIEFAVNTANQCLVPQGIPRVHWDRLSGVERFYLKMLELEARGAKTLDNYQNFAKAFKVRDFRALLGDQRANQARLKDAVELGRTEMSEGSEFYQSVLRAVLYALMELENGVDGSEVLAHLMLNVPNYYGDSSQRATVIELTDYLAKRLEELRPEEASAARVLGELVKGQRLG